MERDAGAKGGPRGQGRFLQQLCEGWGGSSWKGSIVDVVEDVCCTANLQYSSVNLVLSSDKVIGTIVAMAISFKLLWKLDKLV